MQIIADHREERSGVVEQLRDADDVEVTVSTLTVGDYQIGPSLLFERKTLIDFATSIKDGRLFRQAQRLSVTQRKVALVLEGTSRDLEGCSMSRESIQGALISLGLVWGIPVLRSMDMAETARVMLYAGRQLEWIAQGGIKRSGYRPKGKRKRQLYLLQGLPGIGPARAEQLLERFGTVSGVVQASVEEMTALDGFGAKVAQHIYDAVHEEHATYEVDSDIQNYKER